MERQSTRKAEIILKEKNKMREIIYPISRLISHKIKTHLITKSRLCIHKEIDTNDKNTQTESKVASARNTQTPQWVSAKPF